MKYCNKCEYCINGRCGLMGLEIKRIKYTPCDIPFKYLNNVEKYIRQKNRWEFISYMNKQMNISLDIGDFVFVKNCIEGEFYGMYHLKGQYSDRPISYLKIVEKENDKSYIAVDPYHSNAEEEFAEYFCGNPYTLLTPDDFKDVEEDSYLLSEPPIKRDWRDYATPINRKHIKDLINFIKSRKNKQVE